MVKSMKVLLVGSSFSAVPILFDLKKRGAYVAVIGKYENDPCHSYADQSFYEDYSDKKRLLAIFKDGEFDYIVPSCNDYAYLSCAYVANIVGLPGFDTPKLTEVFHFKDRFRSFCEKNAIPVPKIYGEVTDSVTNIKKDIMGRVLVKPVDSFSGRGVQLVRSNDELPKAINEAFSMSRIKAAVIEEYVEGSLHSHTAFIHNGKIIWHDFVDEFCEVYPYQVDRSSYPTCLSTEICAAVNASIEKIVEILSPADGLLHTQFIASKTKYWIIETMRRCPGDLYGHQFKFAFGFDYEHEYVSSFVGAIPTVNIKKDTIKIERRILSSAHPLSFAGIALKNETREMILIPLKESGQKLQAAPFDKVGIAFFKGEKKRSGLPSSSLIVEYHQ